MTKYYVDAQGNYLGGFDGTAPPAGAIEVPFAPSHAADRWTGNRYSAGVRPVSPITAEELHAAMLKKGGVPTRAEVIAERTP